MAKDQETRSGGTRDRETSILGTVSLFALPLFTFQEKMLGLLKAAVGQAREHKPFQTLLLSEIHVLLMLLDPDHRLRNRLGPDLEGKTKALLDSINKGLSDGSLQLIAAHEELSRRITDILTSVKDGQRRKRAGR
jgi:hypothetical protein